MRTMLEVDPMGVESEDVEEVENKEVETPQGRGTKRKASTSRGDSGGGRRASGDIRVLLGWWGIALQCKFSIQYRGNVLVRIWSYVVQYWSYVALPHHPKWSNVHQNVKWQH